ncbi:MAG: hypothetical protein FJ405_07575 [Verrucomicrobia bacterium]|nr:hypothetical protein [Verrucomicrobiota bacterium]
MMRGNIPSTGFILALLLGLSMHRSVATDEPQLAAAWDNHADTWVATDALGRATRTFPEVPAPRPNRTVGIFYFLWLGEHAQGGPFDVTQILRKDPNAMTKPESPLWGPLHVPHHWGESLFGYYRTRDEAVLRKHAQMLSDAGIDVVIFDVTNQITYRDDYRALLRVWAEMRRLGNRTPQVAFLTPFWDPGKVVRELWRDLYSTGMHRDLWFQWQGKPLLLADPLLLTEKQENAMQNTPVELKPGHTLGQSFMADRAFVSVAARMPTWRSTDAAVTLTLLREGPGGERVYADRFHRVTDNEWVRLPLPSAMTPGRYYLEASEPAGQVGWWSHTSDTLDRGEAFVDGKPVSGDRTLRLEWAEGESRTMLDFFTLRKPQPDYFVGQTRPDMWSWLEVYPQHVFTNSAGQKEQMSVGVGQNAVNGRLGSMSEPGAHGRSFHRGATDSRPDAVRLGLNVTEQWNRALEQDPMFVFVTGWNEWIAGRFKEFNGIKRPVMFVDQFDQEHSRDIEPMRGGHGDDYYYQLVSQVRRFKGARPLPTVRSRRIRVDGSFKDWSRVAPEFRDTVGDPMRRNQSGWDTNVVYLNTTGRNDIIAAKASWDARNAWFYARTREPLTAATGGNWMVLFLDLDADVSTGWLGYDVVINRTGPGVVERNEGGRFAWKTVGAVEWRMAGTELELGVAWGALGVAAGSLPTRIDFKWADNCLALGEWSDFTLNGDAAPNDRFNFSARSEKFKPGE